VPHDPALVAPRARGAVHLRDPVVDVPVAKLRRVVRVEDGQVRAVHHIVRENIRLALAAHRADHADVRRLKRREGLNTEPHPARRHKLGVVVDAHEELGAGVERVAHQRVEGNMIKRVRVLPQRDVERPRGPRVARELLRAIRAPERVVGVRAEEHAHVVGSRGRARERGQQDAQGVAGGERGPGAARARGRAHSDKVIGVFDGRFQCRRAGCARKQCTCRCLCTMRQHRHRCKRLAVRRQSAAAVVGHLRLLCTCVLYRPATAALPRARAPDRIARVHEQQRDKRAQERAALRAHRAPRGRRWHRARAPPLFITFVFSARGSRTHACTPTATNARLHRRHARSSAPI